MLKDNGIKVDVHLMLDLPSKYSKEQMPKIDWDMLVEFNSNPLFKVDQLKIYPCVVTEHTQIKKWYDEGTYTPYGETISIDKNKSKQEKMEHRLSNPLYNNIINFYQIVHESIRVNRIIRDIPTNEIFGGTTQTGMRSEIDNDMELLGIKSKDIRYREIGSYKYKDLQNLGKPIFKQIQFESSGGTEYFLSFETNDEHAILLSFLRLRLSKNSGRDNKKNIIFPELVDCALIRELHTYGKVQPCKENKKYYDGILLLEEDDDKKVQHKGLGKKLLKKAEDIALSEGYHKIAVTAGVGVRQYYRKNGYNIDSKKGCYQIKLLNKWNNKYFVSFVFIINVVFIAVIVKIFIS